MNKKFLLKNRYHLVGRVKSEPLNYTIPKVDWLLVEDISIFKSIISHHSTALENARLVPLNEEVREWAVNHAYLSDNPLESIDYPTFLEIPDVLSLRERADVA